MARYTQRRYFQFTIYAFRDHNHINICLCNDRWVSLQDSPLHEQGRSHAIFSFRGKGVLVSPTQIHQIFFRSSPRHEIGINYGHGPGFAPPKIKIEIKNLGGNRHWPSFPLATPMFTQKSVVHGLYLFSNWSTIGLDRRLIRRGVLG